MYTEVLKKIYNKLLLDKKSFVTIALGIIGMLLILLSGSSDKESTVSVKTTENSIITETEICLQLKEMIQSISGVGKAEVMITYFESEEYVYAKNTDEDFDESCKELQSEYIIIDSKSGETGLELKKLYPKVKGVAVVCQGADSSIIKRQIVDMISALFDINSSRISVSVMK